MAELNATPSCAAVLAGARRIVIKAGSSLVAAPAGSGMRDAWMASLARDIAALQEAGTQALLVSSGAVALGRRALGYRDGPLGLEQKQAAAAAGQPILAAAWQQAFTPLGVVTAQALLTLDDTEQRRRWLNSRATLEALLAQGALPVINENDTVATDEIRYGDNDRLAARVAQMSGADVLVLLSDIDGLWSADPALDEAARPIAFVPQVSARIMAMAGGPNPRSGLGSGGMVTKLEAARMAAQAGCAVILASGVDEHPLDAIRQGARATLFAPAVSRADARKSWIMGAIKPAGVVHIDDGAARALDRGASLLPAGMVRCSGDFVRGDVLAIVDAQGRELARGLAAYSAAEAARICGLRSQEVRATLGHDARAAMIHRDNMVLLNRGQD